VYRPIQTPTADIPSVLAMMCLELQFDADDSEARLAARPQHRQRLEQLKADGDLVLAGPWADDSGALLIFRADEARVRQIVEDDPYYTTPGVTVLGVRAWQPIVGELG
jgi:uncharacterized protein